jgi:hypothetical protein
VFAGSVSALWFVERLRFYGQSYGGKTAMRVPPILKDHYALSVCSADFNDWIRKMSTIDDSYGYVFTGKYEMPEWERLSVSDSGLSAGGGGASLSPSGPCLSAAGSAASANVYRVHPESAHRLVDAACHWKQPSGSTVGRPVQVSGRERLGDAFPETKAQTFTLSNGEVAIALAISMGEDAHAVTGTASSIVSSALSVSSEYPHASQVRRGASGGAGGRHFPQNMSDGRSSRLTWPA